MDPFASTIIKQGLIVAAVAGAVAFAIFFMARMASFQHAMTLSLIPPTLP
jgi:hypothetical protein